jgi:hypothetical protein
MTAQVQTTLRTIILQTSRLDTTPAGMLLSGLGHQVTPSASSVDALRELQADGADLVVIDADKTDETAALMSRLAELDPAKRPRAIAVLADHAVEHSNVGSDPADELPPVRVFIRPLHLHGLLGLVKRLERSTSPATGA